MKYVLAIICLTVLYCVGITQNIEQTLVHSVFRNGINTEELIQDPRIKGLKIRALSARNEEYEIEQIDSLTVVKIINRGQMTSDSSIYNSDFQLLESALYYSRYNVLKTRVIRTEEETRWYEYEGHVTETGKLVNMDTTLHIERLLDWSDRPEHTIVRSSWLGEVIERNSRFVYQYDDQKRLINSKEYNDDQELTSERTIEYRDEDKAVIIKRLGGRHPQEIRLLYEADKLIWAEVYENGKQLYHREYKYNKEGLLSELEHWGIHGAKEEHYRYEYMMEDSGEE